MCKSYFILSVIFLLLCSTVSAALDTSGYIEIKYTLTSSRKHEICFANSGMISYAQWMVENGNRVLEKSENRFMFRNNLEELAQYVIDKGFFRFQKKYINPGATEGTYRVLEITIDERTKKVISYEAGPEEFFEIIDALKEAFKKAKR